MPQYEIITFLMDKGFERSKAERISEELGVEIVKDIPHIGKEDIDELEFLTSEERQLLWEIVSTAFQKLSPVEQEKFRSFRILNFVSY